MALRLAIIMTLAFSKAVATSTVAASSDASTTSAISTSTSSAGHDEASDMSEGTNLSRGAQAGIGVACGLFGLAAVLAIGLLLISRYKKRHGIGQESQEQAYRLSEPASTVPPKANTYVLLNELSYILELSADTTARVELEGQYDKTRSRNVIHKCFDDDMSTRTSMRS